METHHNKNNPWPMAGAIVIAGVLIAGSVFLANKPQTAAPTAPTDGSNAPVAVDSSKINTDNEPYIGDKNAPLTIAYFYDYQCPICKQEEETVTPQIIKDYVNTGKAKIVFKDFAFLGEDSQTLGLASRAVWELDPQKFYDWHKAIFDNQGQENTGWATPATILSISTSVLGSTEAAKVQSLMKTNAVKYQAAMDADKNEGAALGVNGTPSVIIGDKLVVGLTSYSQIKTTIDSQLK